MANNVIIIGERNFSGQEKLIDYYVVVPNKPERIYGFSKIYTDHTFRMCKFGIRIDDLVGVKSRDRGIMRLVNYTKLLIPYLKEQYDIPIAA